MEIEVGEYVRTKSGKIDIFKEKDENYMFARCEKNTYWILDIINHSKNITDLIEVGDYVNGYKIDEITDWGVLVHKANGINKSGFSIPVAQYREDIKTILTKELYKANCYTVEILEKSSGNN